MKKKMYRVWVGIIIICCISIGIPQNAKGRALEFSKDISIDGFQISTNIVIDGKDVILLQFGNEQI